MKDHDEMRGLRLRSVLRYIAMAVCAFIVVYEAYQIYMDKKENDAAVNTYDTIEKEYVTLNNSSEKTDNNKEEKAEDAAQEEEATYPPLSIDDERLRQLNADYIGWLYFPAADVSYPVVRENYPDQYLRRTIENEPNNAGSIFMDAYSDPGFGGMSNFIFGHNMRNHTMFGKLKVLRTEEGLQALEAEPYIYIYRADEVIRYRAFAFYESEVGGEVYAEVKDEAGYDAVLRYMRSNDLWKTETGQDFAERPGLLTLSTCTGRSGGTRRFLVSGYKDRQWEIAE